MEKLDSEEWDVASIGATNAHRQAIVIDGSEGDSVAFPSCCHPIPGDEILGYLGKGEGLQIHTHDCKNAQRIHHRDPEHWVDVIWAEDTKRHFDVAIRVDVKNSKGVLAKIAGTLTSADANIAHVSMDDRFGQSDIGIQFLIQVEGRLHLAKVIRRLRQNHDVLKISRVFGK